jgi:NADH-quinone oxidoreductase subunit E
VIQEYGVVTFYNFFNMKPKGKNQIRSVRNYPAMFKGADKILERLHDEQKVERMKRPPTESFHSFRKILGACTWLR